ncbi:MAG: NAD(P)H dehydrogenase assembly family protein, partial [Vulcanococcus sp.]
MASDSSSPTPALSVGDPVRLLQTPPYLKTADAMPML